VHQRLSKVQVGLSVFIMKTIKFLTLALVFFTFNNSQAATTLSQNTLAETTQPATTIQNSQVGDVTIDYARLVAPADRQGFSVYMAAIGGSVQLDGVAPVNVTLRIGGQSYTALTDRNGVFSFFVYANGSSRFEVEAWLPESESVILDAEFAKNN